MEHQAIGVGCALLLIILIFSKETWIDHSGWPIKLEDIALYYPRSQPILDLGLYEYNVNYWQKEDSSFVPLPLDTNVMWNKIWQFSPPTRFGKKYKETIVNAKNIHLFTYANVVDLNAIENVSSIKQVTVKNYANKEHTVKAKYFILACNAIQNARLLLASNKQASKGLGNNYDRVGRYFMEHIEIKSGELWLNKALQLKLYQRNPKASAEIAVSAKKQEELKVLNGTISLMPLEKSKEKLPNIKIWSQDDPRKSLKSYVDYKSVPRTLDGIVHRIIHSDYYQVFALYTRMEQAPNPSSRLILNNEKDSLGVPQVSLNWETTPLDKRSIREINKLLGQQVGNNGIGRVRLSEYLIDENENVMPSYTSGGWHHIGTTRMSESPQAGVVDKNCRVHGINNLYIASSSCFTTGGAVNPTLTIVALSLRLSDYLKALIKN